MADLFSPLTLYRKNFGKIERVVDISNLIEMQRESYARFLQKDFPSEERQDFGLQGVFKSVFPIWDFSSWTIPWATPSTTWTSACSGA